MHINTFEWSALDEMERTALLRRPAIDDDETIRAAATSIIEDVRSRGDAALLDLTKRFDGTELAEFRVSAAEIAAAESLLSEAQVSAIDLAIKNVRQFHEAQRPATIQVTTSPGVHCERVSHPLDAVGLYVPAGTAPLPSAAIMLAVPACIAACPTIVLCTPPRADGTADPGVLVAARRAGIKELRKIGGAQAIAAMAYGTETVPKVGKIFGPGNAYVTAAKAIVSSRPGGAAIDMPAGPSEVLVIGDENASADFIAADLLSQAEHGADSQVIGVVTSLPLAEAVCAEVAAQLDTLARNAIAKKALRHSRIFVVDDLQSAVSLSNRYAPEHLILHLNDAATLLPAIRNAGSVFVGQWTPESVGDYCSGTNHVLPTYGHARNYSGLGVEQFMRQMTVQRCTPQGLKNLGDAVMTLAGLEGLDAHAAAVRRRLDSLQ